MWTNICIYTWLMYLKDLRIRPRLLMVLAVALEHCCVGLQLSLMIIPRSFCSSVFEILRGPDLLILFVGDPSDLRDPFLRLAMDPVDPVLQNHSIPSIKDR